MEGCGGVGERMSMDGGRGGRGGGEWWKRVEVEEGRGEGRGWKLWRRDRSRVRRVEKGWVEEEEEGNGGGEREIGKREGL